MSKRRATGHPCTKRASRATGSRTALVVLAGLIALWIGACSATNSSSNLGDDDGSGANGTGANGLGGDLNLGGSNSGGSGPGPAKAHLSGTVYAPEGTIPISGALVYTTQTAPPAIPQSVHCAKCVDIPHNVHYALTAADGSFTVGVPELGDWKLVVQKGTFRRTRDVQVTQEGTIQPVPADLTTLPRQTVPEAGDFIPKIAVSYGVWDDIQDSLAKLGLGDVNGEGNLVAGTESFHMYEDGPYGPGSQLLTDYNTLSQYHIVFFPCTDSWPNSYLMQQNVIDNLRNFVGAGGKLYVTDYSYDILKRAFDPEWPLKWDGDNGGFDDADSWNYDAQATVNDPGLAEWLAVQGITSFVLEDNWSIVDHVDSYTAPDENGQSQSFTPTVWVSGDVPGEGNHPCTTSFRYGCGRALFSTYHTEAWGEQSLMAQERALLYIILEIAVCVGDYPPPT